MKNVLEQIQILIEQNMDKSVSEQQELLEPLFNEVYDNCRNDNVDIMEILKLSQLEKRLEKRILNVNPKMEPSNNVNEMDKTIEQIVYYSRKEAETTYNCSIINDSLKFRSYDLCNIVLSTSKNLGVPATIFSLNEYFNLPIKHNIVIAYLKSKYYLIDITYQQFFLLGKNFKNRYYETPSCIKTCEIGGRMMNNRRNTAIQLIRDGYIKEENDIKNYFDAFMEFAGQENKQFGYDYLRILLESLKGSNISSERVLYNKLGGLNE